MYNDDEIYQDIDEVYSEAEGDYMTCDRCGDIFFDGDYYYFPIDLPAIQTVLTVCKPCYFELQKEEDENA